MTEDKLVIAKWPLITLDMTLRQIYNEEWNERWGYAPYELWMKYIQPKIFYQDTCWCWNTGKTSPKNASKFYPSARVPLDETDPAKGMKNVNARRWIAQLFWEYPEDYVVYRNKSICPTFNCVNPHHLVITHRNNPEYKF